MIVALWWLWWWWYHKPKFHYFLSCWRKSCWYDLSSPKTKKFVYRSSIETSLAALHQISNFVCHWLVCHQLVCHCTGWVLLCGCKLAVTSIVVSGIGLQRISPTTVWQFPQFPVVTVCNLPDIINCLFHVYIAASSGLGLFLSPDPQFGTHCLMICMILPWTLYNFGGTWRRTCSPDIRSVSTFNRGFYVMCSTNRHSLTYLLTVTSCRLAQNVVVSKFWAR